MSAAMPSSGSSGSTSQAASSPSVLPTSRMLVKDGQLNFWVPRNKVDDAKKLVMEVMNQHGGYLESLSSRGRRAVKRVDYGWGTRGGDDLSVKLRVPVESFDQVMLKVKGAILERLSDARGFSAKLTYETSSARDVTSEYVDTRGRLSALQRAHERLEALMASADKVHQVLSVLSELTSNLQKKEALEARIKTMERLASMATVQVRIEEEDPAAPEEPPSAAKPWRVSLALSSASTEWGNLVDVVSGGIAHALIFDLPVLALGLLSLALIAAGLRSIWLCSRPWLPTLPTMDWPERFVSNLSLSRASVEANAYPDL